MRHGDLMPAFNTIIDFFINSIFDHNKDSLQTTDFTENSYKPFNTISI